MATLIEEPYNNFNDIENNINNLLNNNNISENDLLLLNQVYSLVDELNNNINIEENYNEINNLLSVLKNNYSNSTNNSKSSSHNNSESCSHNNSESCSHNNLETSNTSESNILSEYMLEKIIDANYELAYERIPESLFRCNMINIEGLINDKKVTIFVDTGAEHSIIGYDKAKELGIDYLIDKRHNGIARGVGQQEIIGRIHYVELGVNNYLLPLGFSVLKDFNIETDILLGIDILVSNGINIDFINKCLVFNNIKIPFVNIKEKTCCC